MCATFVKKIVTHKLKNRPIWSHWMRSPKTGCLAVGLGTVRHLLTLES